ncbi:MAG: hypothetical protein WBO57_07140, partial [Gammaproteobacteria bacterium]
KPAMLVMDNNGDIDVYVLTPWDACLRYHMSLIDIGFEWFRSMLGGMLPPLLRLRFDGRSHYLFKRNCILGNPARTAGKFYAELARSIPGLPPPRADGFRYMEWAIRIYALLMIGTVFVAIAASWSPGMDEEPMVLAQQGDGQVLAASHRWLYRFDTADQLVERIDLQSLGFGDGISDMESLDDGRFLVGDSGAGIIKVCDFSARQCASLEGFNDERFFLRSFQFVHDPQHERIYAADSSRHRLLELDAEGALVREIAGPDSVCFPNDPLIAQGMLVIANTNHHKLLAWDLSQAGFSVPAQEWLTVQQGRDDVHCPSVFEAPNTGYFAREIPRADASRAVAFSNARPGQIWPFAMTRGPNGGLWVLNAGNNLQHADLLIFNDWPSDSQPQRVYLDDGIDPISMLVRKNDVLLAENDRPSIIRISHDGRVLGEFGDVEFSGMMASIADRQQMYEQVSLYAKYIVGVLLLVLLIAVPVVAALRIRYIQMQDPSFMLVPDGQSK